MKRVSGLSRMVGFALVAIVAAVFLVMGCDSAGAGGGGDDSGGGGDDSGGDDTGQQNGTLTVSLSNADSAPEGSTFAVFVYESGADAYDQANLAAVASDVITEGTVVDLVLKEPNGWLPSGETWTASGGVSYDAYIYTTTDDEDLDYDTTSKVTDPHPKAISVDGDHSLSFDYESDLVDVTLLTVKATDIPTRGTDPFQDFCVRVFEEGVEPGPDNAVAGNNVAIDGDTAEVIMLSGPDGGVWFATPNENYQVLFILFGENSDYGLGSPGNRHLFSVYTHGSGYTQIERAFDETWGPDYSIGEIGPAGGRVFYENPDPVTDGWKYLEAAPSNWAGFSFDPFIVWQDPSGEIGPNAQGSAIGTGRSNTAAIVAWLDGQEQADRAAQVADASDFGGYHDWFLPSRDELEQMYLNLYRNDLGQFLDDLSYWSSTETFEDEFDCATNYSFTDAGGAGHSGKTLTYPVRPIRAF